MIEPHQGSESTCVVGQTARRNRAHNLVVGANMKTTELLPLRLANLMLWMPILEAHTLYSYAWAAIHLLMLAPFFNSRGLYIWLTLLARALSHFCYAAMAFCSLFAHPAIEALRTRTRHQHVPSKILSLSRYKLFLSAPTQIHRVASHA